MAATVVNPPTTPGRHPFVHDDQDVFTSDPDQDVSIQPYQHRFSSRFDLDPLDYSSTSSPSQLKRTIEAHLQETDRRLLDTQKLGTSLLKQRDDLTGRLEEVEQYQDEAQIPADLRRRLADIEREHADVGREVARALIGPKSKQEDFQPTESGVFTSQATGSPTKISAPSRRHRNQPSTRAGDLQFAADISTSLLAQVRQLQAAVAERDETIKVFNAERDSTDRDIQSYTQRLRTLNESEQKFKDENWNLETQKHELLNAARDAQDKEKRLAASLASNVAEKNRLQSELEEINSAHSKLAEEHNAAKKAHDTEIHGLKRNVDLAGTERQNLQDKVEELMAQNQELAKAFSTRSRSRQANIEVEATEASEENAQNLDTPEDSPPPSPTKATPRHGGLESETLRSSLHHAHRMIQNLKSNIHREKTEKIELKRMLQEARDEVEQRRNSDNGSAAKRQKTKTDTFKKPARPDMLGGTRRARTDIELTDDDWEDQRGESPGNLRPTAMLATSRGDADRLNDLSDAYQTANETEGNFETADERNATESEAFMTGAESFAGDSTDELTETEDTASRVSRVAPGRIPRTSLGARPAGDRASYLSTASTSADEADDTQTPMQSSFSKFKIRSNRLSYGKPSVFVQQSTPESFRSRSVSHDSPATVLTEQSPAGEQTLFAELGGMDEINSETQSLQSTPARSSAMSSQHSTPGMDYTPSKSAFIPQSAAKPAMVDSSTMTEDWVPEPRLTTTQNGANSYALANFGNKPSSPAQEKVLLPSAFPLPPSVPTSPIRKTDTSTQYTPQRASMESPTRPASSYITPPKMLWDEGHERSPSVHESPRNPSLGQPAQSFGYAPVLSEDGPPLNASDDSRAALILELETLQNELLLLRANHEQQQTRLKMLETDHAQQLTAMEADRVEKMTMLEANHVKQLNILQSQISGHDRAMLDAQNALGASETFRSNAGAENARLAAALAVLETEKLNVKAENARLLTALAVSETEKNNISKAKDRIGVALVELESEKQKLSLELEKLDIVLREHEDRSLLNSIATFSPILSTDIHPVPGTAIDTPIVAKGLGMGGQSVTGMPEILGQPRTAERDSNHNLASTTALVDPSTTATGVMSLADEYQEDNLTQSKMIDSATSPIRGLSDDMTPSVNQQQGVLSVPKPVQRVSSHDEGSQTLLTSEQIEEAMRPKKNAVTPIPIPVRARSPGPRSPTRYPGRPSSRNRDVSPIIEGTVSSVPQSPTRRPASSSSNRASSLVSQGYPPLPSDHKDIIAKANTQMESPGKRDSLRVGGIMGPPTMPASAMRRPRTPSESLRAPTPQHGTVKKRGVGSQMSRRSSVSSFASELDERFNIRPDNQAAIHGFQAGPGTDPRMIQAITQTMIGEFLWKYTRKAGSKEMSATRHRRYFWVHPYTKTLYWSEQDPQTAGRTELKAKSVAIESVRVVTDDNPMPPGLHRKSLEVTTPGRIVKFTASTGQRHETWFNALSYLLHRGEEQESSGTYKMADNDITQADIAEFSVNGYGARLVPNDSRMSMSSYNSRTTRGTTSNRLSQNGQQSILAGTLTSHGPSTNFQAQAPGARINQDTIRRSRLETPQIADKDRTIRASSISRIQRMFGSVTGRGKLDNTASTGQTFSNVHSNVVDSNSIYDASVVSDGRREEEDEVKRQRERDNNPGLEDVRACCDGKHNVGTLPHRHAPVSVAQSRLSNAINRSMSRRT